MAAIRPARATQSWLRAATACAALTALIGGVPATLAHYVGWPLPRHLAWQQLRTMLATPLTDTTIIKVLACVVWLSWAMFTLSVAAEIAAYICGRAVPRLPLISGVQASAAALVGAIAMAAPSLAGGAAAAVPVLATAPAAVGNAATAHVAGPGHRAAVPERRAGGAGDVVRSRPATGPSRPRFHKVVAGDNLWDIATRYLGNGERWHQIYALNHHKPQPGGGTLTNPNLIDPGWVLLLPPHHARRPSAHQAPSPAPVPSSPRRPAAPKPSPPTDHPLPRAAHSRPTGIPHPPDRSAPANGQHHHGGIPIPGGGVVGITLAAAISTALVAWRLHRRRIATARWPIPPGPSEPAIPEVIARLRRAHLQSTVTDAAETPNVPRPDEEPVSAYVGRHAKADDDRDGLDEFGAPAGPSLWSPAPLRGRSTASTLTGPGRSPSDQRIWPDGRTRAQPEAQPARPLPAGAVAFGIRGNTELPLHTVAQRGLGLTGQGALGTARALLASLLTARGPGAAAPQVIIPHADAQQLLPEQFSVGAGDTAVPPNLIITDTLTGALDNFEAEITHQLHIQLDHGTDNPGDAPAPFTGSKRPATVALIASPDRTLARRLQAAIEAGQATGATVITLGAWDIGVTCTIGTDGVVTASSRTDLIGLQTFHLPSQATATLLRLLTSTHGQVTDDRPGQPAPIRPGRESDGPPAASISGRQVPPDRSQLSEPQAPTDPVPASRPASRPPARNHIPSQTGPPPSTTDTNKGQHRTIGEAQPNPPPARASALPGSPSDPARPVQVRLLGTPMIEVNGKEIAKGLRRSSRELLAFLALYPNGAAAATITAALWPDHTPTSAKTALQDALRSLRVTLRANTGAPAPMFITYQAGRYHIDPALIDVDLWHFHTAITNAAQALRNHHPNHAREALTHAINSYRGPLAQDTPYEWIEPHREESRRQAVDAWARLAALYEPADPEEALALLNQALTHDPYNEQLYQRIMTIQARLGHTDAIYRTLRLLETRLTDLDTTPTPTTYTLATDLQQRI